MSKPKQAVKGWQWALVLLAIMGHSIVAVAEEAPRAIDLFSAIGAQPATADRGGPEPSRILYPDQRLPLRFSHASHLRRDISCVTCHSQALTSTQAADSLLPREAACQSCHAIDHTQLFKKTDGPPAACYACHPGMPKAPTAQTPPAGPQLEALVPQVEIPPPYLKFNHQLHAKNQVPCATCHGDLSQVDLATRAQLPTMAQCLACHDQGLHGANQVPKLLRTTARKQGAPGRCATCHLMRADGTLQVQFPTGILRPSGNWRGDEHGLDFTRTHRLTAQSDPDYCSSCHRRDYCQQCHNGVLKPMDYHGGDYQTRHGLEARRNQLTCTSCHRQQTFCLGCHERLGVIHTATLPGSPSVSAFAPATSRRFHPDGWASPTPGPSHHAFEAQRNLRTCTSCHREQTCLDCHSALPGGRFLIGKSPHPADFVASGRCQATASRNPRMCLKCHREGSAELTCPN
ncbi:MAG TPA: cytochrome c3 family protein [Pseudomonadota bacterium]|nr:cytochrome c3 family protein [Pseudomonadota bacterium]